MKVSSFLFAVVALILAISLLCIWFYPSIQDFMASNNMWNGIKNFCREFDADNIDSLDDLPESAGESALIAIPYLQYSDEELLKIKHFVNGGGTLLLMDDYGFGNSILTDFGSGIRFSNKPLLDPLFCYQNRWLPKITDFSPDIEECSINVVILNHATALIDVAASQAIAWSSSTSFLDIDENESLSGNEPEGPFPVAAKFRSGKGTIIAISDPSIMINSMVGRDDNHRFIQYLTSYNGEQKSILIDRSHLTKTPLDVSKARLTSAREALSSPYALLGMVAAIFMVVSRYTLKKGALLG